MKNKKWLIILVAIIFFINIAFYITIRLAKVDELVRNKLSDFLTEILDSEVNIGYLTFNDKQINIAAIEIKDKKEQFNLVVKQVYIDYDIFKLLSKQKKKAVKEIKIYDPVFEYKYVQKKEKGEPVSIPEIEDYFGKLQILNGRITVKYTDENVSVKSSWKDVKLSCINTSECNINVSGVSDGTGLLAAEAVLKEGKVKKVVVSLEDYFPENFETEYADDISAKIDLNLNVFGKIIDYSISMKQPLVKKFSKQFTAESIEIVGNTEDLILKTVDAVVDENPINAELQVSGLQTSKKNLHGNVSSEKTDLNRYIPFVHGFASGVVEITGNLNNPRIKFSAESEVISAAEQNLNNVKINGYLERDFLRFSSIDAQWNENVIVGNGEYDFVTGLDLEVNSPEVNYQVGDTNLQGDLSAKILFDKILQISANATNLSITGTNFKLEDMSCEVNLVNDSVNAKIRSIDNELIVNVYGDITEKEAQFNLLLRRFSLNKVFDEVALPMVSGSFLVDANTKEIGMKSTFRVFDRNFGKLDGKFKTELGIDLINDTSEFQISTTNAKYNYNPFELKLNATGTKTGLQTTEFTINEEIYSTAWFALKPDFEYGVGIQAKNIRIKEYLKYFMHHYTANEFGGKATIDVDYDSHKGLAGNLKSDKFRFGTMNEIDANTTFSGNLDEVRFRDFNIGKEGKTFFQLRGDFGVFPEFTFDLSADVLQMDLQDVLPGYSGRVNSGISYFKDEEHNLLMLSLKGDDLNLNGLKVDSVRVDAAQTETELEVLKFTASAKKLYEMSAGGKIGYNFFSDEKSPSDDTLKVNFSGDLLKFLSGYTSMIDEARSSATLSLDLGMGEEGLSVTSGNFYLKKGEMTFPGQIEKADKIYVKFKIEDNVLNFTKFKGRMGEGRVYVTNKHDNDDKDLKLGMLNLGKLYVHTNENGLLFHMPWYMPVGSVAKVLIKGRNTDDLVVSGPFEDLHIVGDVVASNGDAIYPEDTKNILKLLNPEELWAKKKNKEEPEYLPFTLDLMIHTGENVRYVTYPADLLIVPESYLHLKYENGIFSVPNAMFTSENGFIDMFGTTLRQDFTEVRINEKQNLIKISGFYYKKASDGTLITMEVFRDENRKGYSIGGFQFDLYSDDPEDKFMDILAKLRYNRNVSEIAPEQRKTLLQDEVIQIAGLGIETALLDPLISPLENRIRKLLRVDYLYLQTELVRNIFTRYTADKNTTVPEEEQETTELTDAELFLDNLSVHVGKYVTRNLMWDYKMHLQKPFDLAVATEMGVYHDLSLRYDLPYKFQVGYKYSILPFDEENTHEVSLEKSFRFW